MNYSLKIYFEQKPIIFTDDIEAYISKHKEAATYSNYPDATVGNIEIAQQQLATTECLGVLIKGNSQDEVFRELNHLFLPITAAGGLILSSTSKILMIHRRGVWDLPKGKLDDGESIAECAVREVIEETGISGEINLGEELHRSYHVYSYKGSKILKTTHWFAMTVREEWPLQPQAEEDITEAVWIAKSKLQETLCHTWPTIRDVFATAGLI